MKRNKPFAQYSIRKKELTHRRLNAILTISVAPSDLSGLSPNARCCPMTFALVGDIAGFVGERKRLTDRDGSQPMSLPWKFPIALLRCGGSSSYSSSK
jgi:hypothetical protein